MEPIALDFEPGLYRQGTIYQCPPGRFYDGALMRMGEGVRKPMGGWAVGLAGTLSGNPRAAFAWKDNDRNSFAAFATHSKLYIHDGTTLEDITPSGFTAGDANFSDCTMDNFGETLLAMFDTNGTLLEYTPLGGGDATAVANAPTGSAIVVTPERFPVVIGANGNPRMIQWPDQETLTIWTATATNQAGDLELQTKGELVCGVRVNGGTLIFSDHDLFFMKYVGLPDVYGVRQAGDQCGIIGKHAYTTVDQIAYWMGESCFWVWMGYAEQLPCEISDDIFKYINITHRHKVWARHDAKNGEIWFYYPRDAATECSHVAIYTYRGDRHWNHFPLARNCGFEAGVFLNPIMVTSAGAMLKHEFGWSYDGAERFLLSSCFEIGTGGKLLYIDEIVPDESNQGDCEVYIYLSEYPTDGETMIGPFSAADRIPVEIAARKVRMEFRAADGTQDFRLGRYRAFVRPWSLY